MRAPGGCFLEAEGTGPGLPQHPRYLLAPPAKPSGPGNLEGDAFQASGAATTAEPASNWQLLLVSPTQTPSP